VLLSWMSAKREPSGTIHNTTVSSDVQHLGDVEGDLFGLLASRPKEVSLEGPEFGGGHGVFSYYVIKGLEGAADANKDGVVDASELIQYVSNQVPMAPTTSSIPRVRNLRQHDAAVGRQEAGYRPGPMANALRLTQRAAGLSGIRIAAVAGSPDVGRAGSV